jgi:ABC-2 type transport system ATP-binding protein
MVSTFPVRAGPGAPSGSGPELNSAAEPDRPGRRGVPPRIREPRAMTKVLEVAGLRKEYGGKPAVDSVSFEVGNREIVGLLGPNGAGKTTTIHMILGILAPSAGSIRIEGIDVAAERARALERTNFAAVYAPLPGNLTVEQNLRVFGLLYGVADLERRIDVLIAEHELEPFRRTRCGVLSSGEQTRVGLAKAMLNDPHLLLLDEPTASLDPATARDVRRAIKSWVARGSSGCLWTSHNMHEVAEVCDRVLFLSKGKVLLEGDPRQLPGQHGKKTLEEIFIAVAREPLSLELA